MCVDRRLPGSPSQIFVFPLGDVLLSLGVPLLFGQPKIDDVDLIGLLAKPDEEVVWLDVPVDEVLGVHKLNSGDHLVAKHQNCLQRELAPTEREEFL